MYAWGLRALNRRLMNNGDLNICLCVQACLANAKCFNLVKVGVITMETTVVKKCA
jgi:hypothetical protein